MTERNGCVGCKHEHESADSVGCLGCEKNAIDKYQRRTNADMIRSMNDAELAEYICGIIDIGKDKFICGTTIIDYDELSVEDWLKAESEE